MGSTLPLTKLFFLCAPENYLLVELPPPSFLLNSIACNSVPPKVCTFYFGKLPVFYPFVYTVDLNYHYPLIVRVKTRESKPFSFVIFAKELLQKILFLYPFMMVILKKVHICIYASVVSSENLPKLRTFTCQVKI